MKIDIVARNLKISEQTRDYVNEEAKKMLKYFERVVSTHIVLEKESNFEYSTQLVVTAPQKTLTVKEIDKDLIKAVDSSVEKMIRQLKKYKGHFE